ncbi:MAG TPA: preprotein translocase subunit SecG [Syntrophales bacterium]|nr:preprotein translocase subunit SecG [Syntrophales bacterium]HRT61652.1 preprotein translocase subunit SecG [Syntrophales bacterium]
MHVFISIIHVAVCVILILVVLLQRGKGADMGAAFGGSSQTLFGSAGPGTFLGKITTLIAVVFMLTSLWLAYFATHKGSTVMEGAAKAPIGDTAPLPAPPAAPQAPEGSK